MVFESYGDEWAMLQCFPHLAGTRETNDKLPATLDANVALLFIWGRRHAFALTAVLPALHLRVRPGCAAVKNTALWSGTMGNVVKPPYGWRGGNGYY